MMRSSANPASAIVRFTGYSRWSFRVAPVAALACLVLLAWLAGSLTPFDPMVEAGPALAPPSLTHLLGTDDLGRDLASQLLNGLVGSMLLISITATLAFLIGSLVGLSAGYFGGWVDAVLMRLTEFVGVLPRLLIALMAAALIDLSLAAVAVLLGLTSWPGLARIIRAETLAQNHREHVTAARALGCSAPRILISHIAPFAIAPSLAVIGPVCISAILTEAGLGYLGLSDPKFVSWGDLIRNGQDFYAQAWWLATFPGLAVVLTCLLIVAISERAV